MSANGPELIGFGPGSDTPGDLITPYLVFIGPLGGKFSAGGAATIVGSSGPVVVSLRGSGGLVFGGSDFLSVATFAGPSTVVGEGASVLLTDNTLSTDLVFLGAEGGELTLSGTDTVVTGPGFADVDASSSANSELVFAQGLNQRFEGGSAASTVAGVASSNLSVSGGAGGGLFFAGSGENTVVAGNGNATIDAAAGGFDDLSATGSGSTVIVGGAVADTISAAGSTGTNTFFAGSGAELIVGGAGNMAVQVGSGSDTIQGGTADALIVFTHGRAGGIDELTNFDPARDFLMLQGYGAQEVALDVAAARVSSGTETISLSDGTRIVFDGFAGVQASSFV